MESRRLRIGFLGDADMLSYINQGKFLDYIRNETNIYGRLLFALKDYFIKHSNRFDIFSLKINFGLNVIYSNGTLEGIIEKINQSRIDIGIQPYVLNERTIKYVDFSYPYKLYHGTFITRKPEYNPHFFGILQTFSHSVWVAIISVFFVMVLIYYVTLKKRYPLDKTLFHMFAVLLRQSLIVKPTSMADKLLIYAWVVAAMFLCLAYESIFFSFLAIPSITEIKDVSQLARVVEKQEYHCVGDPTSGIYAQLLKSQQRNLKIIGTDLKRNNLSHAYRNVYEDLFRRTNKRNFALLTDTDTADVYAVGDDFVSDDRFLETMAAMMVRKDFCCKKLLENFVHKMMASGLYFYYFKKRAFLLNMPLSLKQSEKGSSGRKLTLIDLAPAFIFLLIGYFISFLILIGEMLMNCRKKIISGKK